jgi:hypothetical protein
VSDTCNGLNNLPISSVASSSTLLGVSDEDVETVAGRRGPRILASGISSSIGDEGGR